MLKVNEKFQIFFKRCCYTYGENRIYCGHPNWSRDDIEECSESLCPRLVKEEMKE